MSLRRVFGKVLLSACIFSVAGILVPAGDQGLAFAQTSKGSVTGRVTDAGGGVIPDAVVLIRSMDTGEATEVRTDSSGVYLVAALQPGNYSITITKDGFDTAQFTSVNINIAAVATLDAQLKIGRTTEVVTVRAEEQLIDRSASNVSVSVPEEVSANIPLPERSAMEVVTLSPGVQGDPQYNMGVQSENPGIYTQPVTPGGSLSVGGGRPGSALQLVDGVDLSMVGYPRVGITFSGDDLKQITVQSTGIEAKYGRSGGGVINQSSKGGSLAYHGKVSFRHMDPFFEATTYGQGTLTFQTAAGPKVVPVTQNVHQNIYTFVFSGPVPISWHNMNKNTFFFASYEPLRAGQKVFTRTRIPTPQELSGDFSNSYTILNTSILASQGYAAAVAAPRVGGIYYQFPRDANGFPSGARYNSSSQYVAVPGNNLSSQLNQNAFAKYVLSQFPTPGKNGSGTPYVNFLTPDLSYANDGNNALTARGVVNKDDRYNIRIDQNLGNSDHVFARYTYVPVVGTRYNFLGPDSPIANQPETVANSRNAVLDYTHIFGGSVSNDVRVSYTQLNYINQPASSSTAIDYAAKYGLTPSLTGVGFPTIAIDTGTYGSSTGGNDGGISNNKVYSVGDDLSFVFRNHSVSIGGEFRAMQLDRLPNAGIFGGSYNFSAGNTNNGSAGGNATASFILGSINTLTLSTYQKFYYRYKYAGLYAMDSWRITPKLTLNYGLRYHLEVPRKEKNGLQGSFVPDVTGALNGVAATGAFAFSGNNGLPESLYPINWKAFEPRVGFAYAATPALVIRGSFGLIHAPMTGVSNSNIPSLTPSSLTIGGANGGTNPAAWVNYMTNPVAIPSTGIPGVLRGPNPFFSYGSNGFLPYVSQSNAVPYTQSWSFGLQYQASRSTVLQATYAGSASRHLFSSPADTNILPLSTIVSEVKSGFNFSSNATVSKYGSAVPSGNANINLVPFPQFSNNPIATAFVRSSSASYNALYLNGIQRAFAGLTLIGSFTWAKSMDDGSSGSIDGIATDIYGFTYPQTPFSKQGEWSYSSFDTPTHVTGAYNWAIPIGRGKNFDLHNRFANGVLGGLSTSGVFNAQSGYPMWAILNSVGYFYSSPSLTAGNYGKNGNAITTGAGHYNLRPNIVPGVPLIQSNWKSDPFNLSGKGGYINPAAFSVPGGPGDPQLGNAPRTLGGARNPRIIYFDMHAAKKISLHEDRINLTFGVDAINIFNHTNFFLNPSTAQHGITSTLNSTSGQYNSNANFGILNSANNTPGRTFALSGALTF